MECEGRRKECMGEERTYLVAKRQVLLAIALSNLNGVIDVRQNHAVIGDVLDSTGSASTLEVAGEGGRSTGPDLDTRTVGSIGHANVVHVDVLDDIDFASVLAQATNADTVGAVANKILHDNVGAVGLERDAVIAVVDDGVLDDDIVGAVCVPAVRVLGGVIANATTRDIDV
jgi:hypothetical protein